MKIYEGKPVPPTSGKIAIIVSRFNQSITQSLLDGAVAKLTECHVPDELITVAWVPGAFELPTLAQRFALDEDYSAVICLGCVIKGETSHDQHINRAVSTELARMGVENGIPIIFGVLTCENKDQALVRSGQSETSTDKVVNPKAGNKGAESAEAALVMINLLESLPPLPEESDQLDVNALESNAQRFRNGGFDDLESDENDFEEYRDSDEDRPPEWLRSAGKHPRHEDRSKKDSGDVHSKKHDSRHQDRHTTGKHAGHDFHGRPRGEKGSAKGKKGKN